MNAGSAAPDLPPVEGQGPIDWGIASATAQRFIGAGPAIPREEAGEAVRRMREQTVQAEGHVRDLTGLGHGLPVLPGDVVDRAGWVRAATAGLAALTDHALPRATPGLRGNVLARTAGFQAGMVLAYLGGRVLGQYDPFGGDGPGGRLLVVAPNVVATQRALRVPEDDFALWVCLHEATHRLQFTAVPWLRDFFAAQVGELLSIMDESTASVLTRLAEALKTARTNKDNDKDSVGLLELLQSPEQRVVLDRLIALSTLLEGHAEHVMDAVGPSVVPSVSTIRARFSVRRGPRGNVDRLLRALLGVDAKVRQYAQGSAFVDHVVAAVGMDGFNAVWTSPETLPTRAEIADPSLWLRRVR
ncbi:zinc-dependent metalloprotease [Allokutzneria oryzae]|uniref:Zinc-dependent metalloprotease n=1 Tax=Allokutzneria oryzae TaxID=1378989 RepID=A0ABV5ZZ86_9PSEU